VRRVGSTYNLAIREKEEEIRKKKNKKNKRKEVSHSS
jgi:hypothetical protein